MKLLEASVANRETCFNLLYKDVNADWVIVLINDAIQHGRFEISGCGKLDDSLISYLKAYGYEVECDENFNNTGRWVISW